ncbi:hypothetical protein K505DRAFT_187 [Melanomma pulvis-pyrius CBS 109.77]|uniref:Uncharacterized protein n=1 Tax=Melanomma pulvis-pyrius CBS 109.77 TaxID=1314802 RepID=A0A6A6XX51_9PLEO|nr:hypothetical protein K505DRAFT_187 [Melanomma pulvis-pyrius CBS 109.77]
MRAQTQTQTGGCPRHAAASWSSSTRPPRVTGPLREARRRRSFAAAPPPPFTHRPQPGFECCTAVCSTHERPRFRATPGVDNSPHQSTPVHTSPHRAQARCSVRGWTVFVQPAQHRPCDAAADGSERRGALLPARGHFGFHKQRAIHVAPWPVGRVRVAVSKEADSRPCCKKHFCLKFTVHP